MKATMRELDVLAGMTNKPMSVADFTYMCRDRRLIKSLIRKGFVDLDAIPATEVTLSDAGRATLSSGKQQ